MVTVFINYHTDLFMKYLRYSFNLFVCLFINGTSLSDVFKGTVHQLVRSGRGDVLLTLLHSAVDQ